ncbi:MAG TPA: FAD-binding oxidoreductase [Solirubrobacteraceae bacterium]|jgi:FAD/FMN-containing dehydrogenase|nr:FAD-binding oxidoreductase [Solirubrobacteraceae bacterium]
MSATIAPVLGEATVQELREAIRGHVLRPEDDGYTEASRIWNGAFDGRRPAMIIRCSGAADVIAAVGFARSNDLAIAVRGGGHSIAGFSSCDDGVVIDLSAMASVRVDPQARRAYVGPGAVWGDVDHETQAHALATTGGLVSSTGVAGFTLGGGIGWLMRKHGLACDNLLGADVVTADGCLVHTSESENPDLLWGLRGGGGNFGVVTQFELGLHPVGPVLYAGLIFFSAEHDTELMRLFREWAPGVPDDITAALNLTTAPPLPVVPEEWHGRKVIALIAVSAGPVDEAEAHFRAFREAAEPVADLLGPMPYTAMQTLIDPLWPKGINAYFKATNLARLDDELIERLARQHESAPGPQCEIHVHQMGGAVARVGDEDTAFSERSMPFVLNAVTGWHEPGEAVAHTQWARAVIDAATDASTGRAYVNFLGDGDAARSSYGPETYARLLALKQEYDPTNVFRLNQNIAPNAAA